MLNEALLALGRDAGGADAPVDRVSFASAVRLGSASDHLGTTPAEWPADVVEPDPSSGFEMRMSAVALAELRAEVRRGARAGGARIETGGMLLGGSDDATGIVYVDQVSGPPPDSYLSETYFQHGMDGVHQCVDQEVDRLGRPSGFVGFWHAHPEVTRPRVHRGAGHGIDRRARWHQTPRPHDDGGWSSGPLGAQARRRPGARPDVYVRIVPRSARLPSSKGTPVTSASWTFSGCPQVPTSGVGSATASRCGSTEIEGLNETLLATATEEKLLRNTRLRADTTVVPSNVSYPTDSGLLAKAIGRIAATQKRLQAAGGATRTMVRDRSRAG